MASAADRPGPLGLGSPGHMAEQSRWRRQHNLSGVSASEPGGAWARALNANQGSTAASWNLSRVSVEVCQSCVSEQSRCSIDAVMLETLCSAVDGHSAARKAGRQARGGSLGPTRTPNKEGHESHFLSDDIGGRRRARENSHACLASPRLALPCREKQHFSRFQTGAASPDSTSDESELHLLGAVGARALRFNTVRLDLAPEDRNAGPRRPRDRASKQPHHDRIQLSAARMLSSQRIMPVR